MGERAGVAGTELGTGTATVSRGPSSAVLLILVFALVSLFSFRSLDVFWHLRSGDCMRAEGRVLLGDPFSHTAHGVSWIAHSWGGAVLMSWVFSWGGFPALQLMKAGLIVAILTVLLVMAADRGHRGGLPRLAGLLLAVIFLARQTLLRPKLFTILFLAVQEAVLFRARSRPRLLLVLVPLYLVWANLHGGVMVGLGLLGLHGLGRLLDGGVRRGRVLCVACVMPFVCLCNPRGIDLLLYPFQYLDSGTFTRFIQEWQPLTPASSPLQFLAMIGLCACLAVLARRKGLLREDMLIGSASLYLSVRFMRNEYLLALTLVPMVWARLAPDAGRWARHFPARRGEGRQLLHVLLLLTLVASGMWLWRNTRDWEEAHGALSPRLVDAMLEMDTRGMEPVRLLNEFAQGGHLIWRGWPRFRVAIDGRNDFYQREGVFQDYVAALSGEEGLRAFLHRHPCDMAITRRGSALDRLLAELPASWIELRREPEGGLWRRSVREDPR